MTNLTVLELAAFAVAVGEEEGAERKRRRWAVHPEWSKTAFLKLFPSGDHFH